MGLLGDLYSTIDSKVTVGGVGGAIGSLATWVATHIKP